LPPDAGAQVLRKHAGDLGIRPDDLSIGDYEGIASVEGRRVLTNVWIRHDWSQGFGKTAIGTIHPVRGDEVREVKNGRLVLRPLHPDES